MCGIAGGLHLEKEKLSAMLRSLLHRGPDGQGQHLTGSFSMGMRRLAILDLENGQQPFKLGKITAVCNGEIYNWKQLRSELEAKGYFFQTQCDAEILPAAWLEWGADLAVKLNGMFAIAIHDEESDVLYLARDRCGQKPLYMTADGMAPFRFASEIKALGATGISLKPDLGYLSIWLNLRYLPEPKTMFEQVETLPAAHWCMISSDGSRKTRSYWKPDVAQTGKVSNISTGNNAIDTLDHLSRSSVELASHADVPMSAYLSAGVDSSLLCHYMRDLEVDFHSVSIGFGAESDEQAAAMETAKHLGIKHHPVLLEPESLADLPRVVSQMDLPVGDALILAFDKLGSHAVSTGAKVALGGEGPDEHFAGYSFQKFARVAQKMGPLGRKVTSGFLKVVPNTLLDKIGAFPASFSCTERTKIQHYLRDFSGMSRHHQTTGLHSLFSPEDISQVLHPDFCTEQLAQGEPEYGVDTLSGLLANQYASWLPDWSLIRQDRNTMAHSLEYRAPFLDHRIIDFAFTLDDKSKVSLSQDKSIWRELASRHLPQHITQRPKQPFYLPLESSRWRKPFIDMAHSLLAKQDFTCHGLFNPDYVRQLLNAHSFLPLKQLAAILILQIWMDQHTSS